jgi:hypothetical protein
MKKNNYIDLKYYLPIKSVKNNSDYIIQITGRHYAHCVLPNTSEPKIILSFLARFNIVFVDIYNDENIKNCNQIRKRNSDTYHQQIIDAKIAREEITQNDVLVYEDYNYLSNEPLVLYPDREFIINDQWFKNTLLNGYSPLSMSISPRIMKSIKNNSIYYIVFKYNDVPMYCIPPKTDEPFIFNIEHIIDTVIFYDQPNDRIVQQCLQSRKNNTPQNSIDLSDREMYNIHLFLYFETDFNGNRYNIPLYYLLTYNVMPLGDVTIKSYHNFTNYFFVLYDDSRAEYMIQPNKSRNKASIITKTSLYLQRIDNPETLFRPKIVSLSSFTNESLFTKLASTTLKSKSYDDVTSSSQKLYYASRLPKLTNESETTSESISLESILPKSTLQISL